eukprot:GHVT01012189.1.p1 GENE.GHVT01012189.1~~GHVT01012189.1.p1  ORF type:complete len:409 (-),score=27.03 GHVT01012189.1:307-1533(-)
MTSACTSPPIDFARQFEGQNTTVRNLDKEPAGSTPTASWTSGPLHSLVRFAPLALVVTLTAGGLLATQLPKVPSSYVASPHAAKLLPSGHDAIPASHVPPFSPSLSPPLIHTSTSKDDSSLASLDGGKSFLSIGTAGGPAAEQSGLWGGSLTSEEQKQCQALVWGRGRNQPHSFLASRLGRRLRGAGKTTVTIMQCISAMLLSSVNATPKLYRVNSGQNDCMYVDNDGSNWGNYVFKCPDIGGFVCEKPDQTNVKNLPCYFETTSGVLYKMSENCAIVLYNKFTNLIYVLAMLCKTMAGLDDEQLYARGHNAFFPNNTITVINDPITVTNDPITVTNDPNSIIPSTTEISTQSATNATQIVGSVGAGLTVANITAICSVALVAVIMIVFVSVLVGLRKSKSCSQTFTV